ncbi:hypothetical protein ES702_01427 [subsurface metagenome]
MFMFVLLESLFLNLSSMITLENIKRVLCLVIGIVYFIIKFRFKITHMPSYMYNYSMEEINTDTYNEILKNYVNSVFIISVIEGFLIFIILLQYVSGIQISIEISQSGFII